MSTIRSGPSPAFPPPTVQPAPNSAARTAQQAFFRAALDRVQAPSLAEPTRIEIQADQPRGERLPRPGALLDIRI